MLNAQGCVPFVLTNHVQQQISWNVQGFATYAGDEKTSPAWMHSFSQESHAMTTPSERSYLTLHVFLTFVYVCACVCACISTLVSWNNKCSKTTHTCNNGIHSTSKYTATKHQTHLLFKDGEKDIQQLVVEERDLSCFFFSSFLVCMCVCV